MRKFDYVLVMAIRDVVYVINSVEIVDAITKIKIANGLDSVNNQISIGWSQNSLHDFIQQDFYAEI